MNNSELLHLLDEAIAHGEGLINAAKAIRRKLTDGSEPESGPASQPETAAETCEAEAAEATKPEKLTFTEVRKVCSAKSHEGYSAQVKDLIARFGGKKLSDVKEEDYQKLMDALKEIA